MKPGPVSASAAPPPKARKGLLFWTAVSVGGFALLFAIAVLVILVLLRGWMTKYDLELSDATHNPEKVFAIVTPHDRADGTKSPLLYQSGELVPNSDPEAIETLNRMFPDWVPVYPGTKPQNTGATMTGPTHLLYFEFRTDDSPEQILEFYKAGLAKYGLSIVEDRVDIHQGYLRATSDNGRSLIVEAPHEGATSLTIDDPAFEGEARP